MKRLSTIVLILASAVLISLLFSNSAAAQSTNKCNSCHGSYYQYLDLKEGDAGNSLPMSLAVGETKTVTVVVGNMVSPTSPTYGTLSSVSVTLSSQNGHFSVDTPRYNIGTISPGSKKTATWTITGTSAGTDSLKMTASAKNTHESLSYTDVYSPSPSMAVTATTPPPPNPGDNATVIYPQESPAIVFSVRDQLVMANANATFDATGTLDPGNNTLLYRWDFGDGTPMSETRSTLQTHVYETPGVYPVTLTVNNGRTEVSQTMEILVAEQPSYDWLLIWAGMGLTTVGTFGVIFSVLRKDEGKPAEPSSSREVPPPPFFNLDPSRCVGCGFCARRCPGVALTLENRRLVHSPSKCRRCLGCMKLCPRGAIDLYLQGKN